MKKKKWNLKNINFRGNFKFSFRRFSKKLSFLQNLLKINKNNKILKKITIKKMLIQR